MCMYDLQPVRVGLNLISDSIRIKEKGNSHMLYLWQEIFCSNVVA